MGLKKRFTKKETTIKTMADKQARAELTLVKSQKAEDHSHDAQLLDLQQKLNSDEMGENSLLAKQLSCYHKINELYQDNSLSLFNLMDGILKITCFGVGAQGGSLWIKDQQTGELTCKVANGPGSEKLIGYKVQDGQGIVGWTSSNRRSTIVYDASKDERFIGKKEKGFKTKTLIASPLVYGTEVIGVLEVVNKDEKEGSSNLYTDADKYFLDDLSTFVAMYIKTSRVIREQDVAVKRMETFKELQEKFGSTLELENLLPLVLQKAIGLLGASVGSIWMVEESAQGIVCDHAVGPTRKQVEGVKLKKGTGIIGAIVEDLTSVIIEDCSTDKRFSNLVDNKTQFVTKTMVAAPFVVKGECIGAIQIINKKNDGLFSPDDLKLLELFASSAAMSIKNARLFGSEKKAKDLSALINISKEITSTLDLNSVLLSIVNLSSQIIPFDESAMSTTNSSGRTQLMARSGQLEIDLDKNKNKLLQDLHQSIAKQDSELIYVSSVESCPDDIKGLKEYMTENELQTFWAQTLKDDQGVVGVMSLESEQVDLITDSHTELLNILTSQSTVALRNAELYNTIPNAQLLKTVKHKTIDQLLAYKSWSKKTYAKIAGGIVSILLLMFLPVPHQVGTDIELLPTNETYYSEVNGNIEKIHVREGQHVKKGELLVEIDTEAAKLELASKHYLRQKTKTEMLKMKGERRIADYKIKESELISLDYEIQLLKKKINSSKVYSKHEGVIISENLEDLYGMPVNFGQELLKVANKDKLIVQFQVPEEDVNFVANGQEIKFKVYGHPTKSFGTNAKIDSVAAEGRQVLESDPARYYFAKSLINVMGGSSEQGILKPGMTGRGKIYAQNESLGVVVFRKLYNFVIMEFLF